MKQEKIEKILEYQGFGIAGFSSDFTLVHYNGLFLRFCLVGGFSDRAKIDDVIPETFGLEEVLKNILAGKEEFFILENVNRKPPDDDLRFYNLYFYPCAERKIHLLCLVKDVTADAIQRQKMYQQKYDIRMLEGLLASRRGILADTILGNSRPIRELRSTIEKVTRVAAKTVLLQGETGTGKNLMARVIHAHFGAKNAPFVEVNSAAIPETLLESELFGYEKGAFTHAVTSRRGLLEEADQGTLFLDEIGELSLNLQAKLLSFLETRKFRRLGSNREIEVDVRLIAATNRKLQEEVEQGRFREDLFYRLNVVTLELPPLRDLEEDILTIARHFIRIFNDEFKKHVKGFNRSAEEALLSHHWPGNVRELANCIERAMIFIDNEYVDAADLVISHPSQINAKAAWTVPPEGIDLVEVEKKLICSALEQSSGNKSRAARLLGISHDTLRYRLEKYALD